MTEEDEEFNRIERESAMRKESVRAAVKQDQSSDLVDRLSEQLANFERGRQVGRNEALEVAYKQSLAYGKTGECIWIGIQANARKLK